MVLLKIALETLQITDHQGSLNMVQKSCMNASCNSVGLDVKQATTLHSRARYAFVAPHSQAYNHSLK